MIDTERKLDTTYRLSRHSTEGVTLRAYPPAAKPVSEGWYRMDQLPPWMIEAMALLDAAHPGEVEGLGRRVGETVYWIEPPSRGTAGDRIARLIAFDVAGARASEEANRIKREKLNRTKSYEKTT